jgi:hypothetical protein
MDNFPVHTHYFPKIGSLQFPLFKFMKKEHAASLMATGAVHLPSMFEFRNENKYAGKIVDRTEGFLTIENQYTHYVGRAKDAEGLIPHNHKPYDVIAVRNYEIGTDINTSDALIYCAASKLFSDTLSWAFEDGKNTCIMIMDTTLFFSEVHNKIKDEYDILGPQSCIYVKSEDGKIFEKNPTANSETNFFLGNPASTFFAKPKSYEPQREVRAIFSPKNSVLMNSSSGHLNAKPISVPEIRSTLFEIMFEHCDPEVLLGKKAGEVCMKVHRLSGQPTVFSIKEPRGVFSPVFFKGQNNESMMGLSYPGKNNDKFSGASVSNCDVSFGVVDDQVVFAINAVLNIEKIEIYTQ